MKYPSSLILPITILLSSCDKNKGPVAMLTGTITPDNQIEGEEISGDFLGYKAFGFDDQGTLIAYISSNQNSTCDEIAKYINVEGNSADIVNVFSPKKCNMFIKVTNFEGSIDASDDPFTVAGSSIICPMGDGDFEYENLGNGNGNDYVWSGREWHGIPSEYTWVFVGDKTSGYSLDIDMTAFEGAFIKEELAKYPAKGRVEGIVDVEVCSNLATSGHF